MISFENSFYDGEDFITFDLVNFVEPYNEITLAVTDRGKIKLTTYDLFIDKFGNPYFEYCNAADRVYLKDLNIS